MARFDMPNGSYSLAEFPLNMVELACDKCGRHGRLRKARLIEQYGPDIPLPDLRVAIAKCERAGKMSDGCGVYYVALAAARRPDCQCPPRVRSSPLGGHRA
jgi:hypothetical protein